MIYCFYILCYVIYLTTKILHCMLEILYIRLLDLTLCKFCSFPDFFHIVAFPIKASSVDRISTTDMLKYFWITKGEMQHETLF